MTDCYECKAEAEDIEQSQICYMWRILSLQSDFQYEKLLLQLVIERARHKHLFLPTVFHFLLMKLLV